jgi:SAM-dependent methyltransferase
MKVPFARSFRGLFSPARRMREDWDERARQNARYYVDCGHGGSDEEFWRSGPRDVDDFVLEGLALSREAEVLEVGCGLGRLLRPMSERVARATGVDISGEMIARAAQALADRPNVRLVRTDGDFPGTPDASLDLVYSFVVFQHVPSRAAVSRYFAEAGRVLRAGGVLRFQADGRPRDPLEPIDTWRGVRYTAAALRDELSALGFDVADVAGEGSQYMRVTARRRTDNRRPETSAVRILERAWDGAALDALLARLGRPAAVDRPKVESGAATLRGLSEGFLAARASDAASEFVTAAYRTFLGREPDPEGLAFYTREVQTGTPRAHVVDCFLGSAELDRKLRPPRFTSSSLSA